MLFFSWDVVDLFNSAKFGNLCGISKKYFMVS